MMNKKEKEAVRLIAMEAYEILDDINCNAVFSTIKNGNKEKDVVTIGETTYEKLLHLLRLIERAHVEQDLKWFDYGQIPDFSLSMILKEFNK